jgi:agmatinase
LQASDEIEGFFISGQEVAREPTHKSFAELLRHGVEEARTSPAVIFGVPFDLGTQHHLGTYLGPIGIRRAFSKFRPYSVELGFDFSHRMRVTDLGNISIDDYKTYDETFRRIGLTMRWILSNGGVPIMLGGDDSINFPAATAFAQHHNGPVGVIWIDNHYDCFDIYRGDPYHCGCPLRNLLVSSKGKVRPENVVHIGSRGYGNSFASASNAKALGFHIRTMDDVEDKGAKAVMREAVALASAGTDSFYVNVDIDSLDIAYGPGSQAPRPGGLTSRELLTMVREAGLGGAGAMAVVEVAPPVDVADATSTVAAACVMEMLGGVASRLPAGVTTARAT